MTKRTRRRRREQSRHRAGYPSPAERERIIRQRDALVKELASVFVTDRDSDQDRRIAQLARRYGLENLRVVLDVFATSTTGRDYIGEEAFLYRAYRRAFARFGGDRPFLDKQEYERLVFEHALLYGKRDFLSARPPPPSPRERELFDLLLVQADYWQDITPPAVPPRPVDYTMFSPGVYGDPVHELLAWGWDLERHAAEYGTNESKWRPAIPDLVRMTLDKGLLNGWPGETSSWAPYHALSVLGHLGAHQVAGHLMALLNMENDWLSDRLPSIWAQMGPQVEPLLWEYIDDRVIDAQKRSVALKGIELIAQLHPARRRDGIASLARRLQLSSAEDARINGYVVFILNRMQATEAGDAIVDAFELGKVDTTLITLEDVTFL
jgi:hypothetical protein